MHLESNNARPRSSRSSQLVIALAVLIPLGVFLWHASIFNTVADDAYITYRYARNLARGTGAVWNPGERVEGYSNFLWMVLLAFFHALFRLDLPILARVLSLLCGAGTVALTFALVSKVTRSFLWATVASACIACCSSFAAHASNGLESAAFAFLVIAVGWALTTKSIRLLAAALVCVSTCRFEGALIVVVAAISVMLCGVRSRTGERFLRAALVWAPTFLLWNVGRRAYYGHWVPNSVAAKQGRPLDVCITNGIAYVRAFLEAERIVLAVIAMAGVALLFQMGRRRSALAEPAVMFLFLASLAYTAFVVSIGGDWMPAWRMMAHIAPAILAVGVILVAKVRLSIADVPFARRLGQGGILVTCLAAGTFQIRYQSMRHENLLPRIVFWRDQVLGLGEMGRWLNQSLPKDTVVATFAAGALPYYADLPCLDVLGLTDAHIAREGHKDPSGAAGHISTDWPYVVRRRPAIYVSTGGGGFANAPTPRIERSLQATHEPVEFTFLNTQNPQGRFVTLMLLKEKSAGLRSALVAKGDVALAP